MRQDFYPFLNFFFCVAGGRTVVTFHMRGGCTRTIPSGAICTNDPLLEMDVYRLFKEYNIMIQLELIVQILSSLFTQHQQVLRSHVQV